jgi:hypothetical protein
MIKRFMASPPPENRAQMSGVRGVCEPPDIPRNVMSASIDGYNVTFFGITP